MARIVFFGNERLATGVTTECPVLTALLGAGHEIVAVVTKQQPARSRSAGELEIVGLAKARSLRIFLPEKLSDIADELAAIQADVGVLAAFGQMVPESIISLFPAGIVNLHPSLMPLHRGPTPLESVILEGASQTGVSIMKLVKAMDAGPVYGYAEVDLDGQETKQQLADELSDLGAQMIVELLPGIIDGSIVPKPQDETGATYDKLITKDRGEIDWTKPAAVLVREVRALAGWPKSRAEIGGKDVVVTEARAIKDNSGAPGQATSQNGELVVATGDGSLVITKLKPAGKPEMPAAAFLAGNKI